MMARRDSCDLARLRAQRPACSPPCRDVSLGATVEWYWYVGNGCAAGSCWHCAGPKSPTLAGGRVLSEEIAEFERGAINFGCVGQRRGQKSGGNSSGCGKGQQPKNAPTRSCSSRRAAAWWCLELSLLADGAPKHSSSFGFSLAAERAPPLLRAGAMAAYVSRCAHAGQHAGLRLATAEGPSRLPLRT